MERFPDNFQAVEFPDRRHDMGGIGALVPAL